MNKNDLLFIKLLRIAISDNISDELIASAKAELFQEDSDKIDEVALKSLMTLAKRHDLAFILSVGLERCGVDTKNKRQDKEGYIKVSDVAADFFSKQENIQIYRYMQLTREYRSLCAALDETDIEYMPIKGPVIRALYPHPEMRVSSDIDILVHEADLDRILTFLESEQEYEIGIKNLYDVSTYSPAGVHIEVHFALTEEKRYEAMLNEVWTGAKNDGKNRYIMSPEMQIIYAIEHTAKHFHNGGCGIRFLIDLFMLQGKLKYDEAYVFDVLNKCSLAKFYEEITRLSRVWFCGEAHSALTHEMENYILGSGIYGSTENKVAVFSTENGGKIKYTLLRIFPPRSTLALYYPTLKKSFLLYPYYAVKRWFRILTKSRKNAFAELKSTVTLNSSRRDGIMKLISELGLEVKNEKQFK